MNTPLHSVLWVFLGSFIGSFGAVFLKLGANRLQISFTSLAANWRLMAGVTLYLLSSVFYLKGLSDGEVSVLFPMVSFGYVWTMLWSRMFFGEAVTRQKLVALAFIFAGIFVLNLGNR